MKLVKLAVTVVSCDSNVVAVLSIRLLAMVIFLGHSFRCNKEEKSFVFHIWNILQNFKCIDLYYNMKCKSYVTT